MRFLDCLMSCIGQDEVDEALEPINDKLRSSTTNQHVAAAVSDETPSSMQDDSYPM